MLEIAKELNKRIKKKQIVSNRTQYKAIVLSCDVMVRTHAEEALQTDKLCDAKLSCFTRCTLLKSRNTRRVILSGKLLLIFAKRI